jgi:hypothetical protein
LLYAFLRPNISGGEINPTPNRGPNAPAHIDQHKTRSALREETKAKSKGKSFTQQENEGRSITIKNKNKTRMPVGAATKEPRKKKQKGNSCQEKCHVRHAKLQALNVEQQIMTQQLTIIRESHGIMDAKPYASKFLEKHYGDLLRDDGDAKKSPAIDLAESSSDEDSVELLSDNTLGSDNGGGDDTDGDSSCLSLNLTDRFF